jgi:hypothetical protein
MIEEETTTVLLPMDLKHFSKGALLILAQDMSLDVSLLKQILEQEKDDPETVRCLIRNPSLQDEDFNCVLEDLSEELRQEIDVRQKALVSIQDQGISSPKTSQRSPSQKEENFVGGNIQKKIQRMSPVDKLCFALKGTKEARGILIRDPNKEIALTVLKNPKITESEVEFYAASTNVVGDIPREIGKNREWCKKYNVLRALVFNPKTPTGVSLERLPYLKEKDLKFLSKSKNVPSALRAGAKRLVANRERKKG